MASIPVFGSVLFPGVGLLFPGFGLGVGFSLLPGFTGVVPLSLASASCIILTAILFAPLSEYVAPVLESTNPLTELNVAGLPTRVPSCILVKSTYPLFIRSIFAAGVHSIDLITPSFTSILRLIS